MRYFDINSNWVSIEHCQNLHCFTGNLSYEGILISLFQNSWGYSFIWDCQNISLLIKKQILLTGELVQWIEHITGTQLTHIQSLALICFHKPCQESFMNTEPEVTPKHHCVWPQNSVWNSINDFSFNISAKTNTLCYI